MRPRIFCTVEGCTTQVAAHPTGAQWMQGHEARPHERCVCGWAGISLNKHLGQVKRLGYGGTHTAIPADLLDDIVTRMRLAESPFADEVAEVAEALRRRPGAATTERDAVGPTDWSVLAPA